MQKKQKIFFYSGILSGSLLILSVYLSMSHIFFSNIIPFVSFPIMGILLIISGISLFVFFNYDEIKEIDPEEPIFNKKEWIMILKVIFLCIAALLIVSGLTGFYELTKINGTGPLTS